MKLDLESVVIMKKNAISDASKIRDEHWYDVYFDLEHKIEQ